MHTPSPRARRGFTILEMIVSMTLLLSILGLSTRLFRVQSRAMAGEAGRLNTQQSLRFAVSMLDRDLRMAGVGVADEQPLLVMAGPNSITFNADLTAHDTGDLAAVYVNPDADSAAVGVMRTSSQITLPGTAIQYPESTYMLNVGVPSDAETITYWLSKDSTSSTSNEYILFRRTNARTPRLLARGIILNPGDVAFQYWKADTSGLITQISNAALPIVHTAPVHGSPADTAKSALTDSVRQVRVRFASQYVDKQTGTTAPRVVQQTIHLLNAGLIQRSTCGNPPLGVAPTATVTAAGGANPQTFVTISWSASVDDRTGEKDVVRYAIYRRLSTAAAFGEPMASVPAGTATYAFKDTDLLSGQSWIYGVAAQDCTPLSSPIGATTAVDIP